ncbi:hypothetical protein [Saccharothrix xinjiangensis]|uniref:Uncharacterized protein n=1 Tax=Saccharothrix xinjiangensis TaxID=204798 RepID=A0ABV9Y3C9_9PSEU
MTDLPRGSDDYRRSLELTRRTYAQAVRDHDRPTRRRVVRTMTDAYGAVGLRDLLATLLLDLAAHWPRRPRTAPSGARLSPLTPDLTDLADLLVAAADHAQHPSTAAGTTVYERMLSTITRVRPVVQAALEQAAVERAAYVDARAHDPFTGPVHHHLAGLSTASDLAAAIHLVGSAYGETAGRTPLTA